MAGVRIKAAARRCTNIVVKTMAKRSPKLALRQSCVLDLIEGWPAGSFLEVGAGIGYMTRLFLDRGHWGLCYDLDRASRDHLRHNLKPYGDRIRVLDALSNLPEASCDYLLAFEVLEHIDDDRRVLADWSRYLKPGGRLMVSVPAHQRHYGPADVRVGHVRRYERAALFALLGQSGYQSVRLVNYGFPLTSISRRLANRLLNSIPEQAEKSLEQRSLESSYTRPPVADKALSLVSEAAYRPFAILQRLFYQWDWGDGIVAEAVKGP